MNVSDLQELGMSKNESKIFLELLRLGEAPAIQLIKTTGYHRNIIYDNLERLIDKGLVTYICYEKKRVFRPSKATALIEMIEEKEKKIEDEKAKAKKLTKEVQEILNKSKKEFKTIVYQGIKGIKEILYEVLEEKEYWGIGISNASVEVLGETFWKNYILKIKQKKVKERLLLNSDFIETVPISSPRNTKIKFLPNQVSLITEILIFGKKVAIIIYTSPPIATIIENEEAVKSFLSYFKTLWIKAKQKR